MFIPDSRTIRSVLKENEDKSYDELLICDFAMPGFMLVTKRLFDISGLMPMDNEEAFAGLVLPPNTKKTFHFWSHYKKKARQNLMI